MRNYVTRNHRNHGFLRSFLMGVLAYYAMPRFCPKCFGVHFPMFGYYGCHYPGDGCR